MGLHSEFFALDENEFATVLRGWKHPAPPVAEERELRGVNPFTGEALVIRTRANPNQPEADADAVKSPDLAGVTGVVSWKWIMQLELAELAVAVGVVETLEEANELVGYLRLIGPMDSYGGVHQLPTELVEGIANTGDEQLSTAAANWISLRHEEVPFWSAEQLVELLGELRELAQSARQSTRRMYLHYGEP